MMTTDLVTADEILAQVESVEPAPQPSLVQVNPYVGIAAAPFSPEAAAVLMAEIPSADIEVRPDGLIYLPEIKYRRILNRAFGPGAWSLLPIEITVAHQDNMLYYKGALFVHGRFVSESIGEQQYFPENDRMSYATAAESAKSNCLMRCCKDLGVASELWDPSFSRRWIAEHCIEVWCQNIGKGNGSGSKKKMWRKRTAPAIEMWPWREEGGQQTDNERREARKEQAAKSEKPAVREKPQQSAPQLPEAPHPADAPAPASEDGLPWPREERASYSTAPKSNATIISFKQAKRYRAIAKDCGWNETEQLAHCQRNGFQTTEEITRNEYDRMCLELQDVALFNDIRNQVAAPGIVNR